MMESKNAYFKQHLRFLFLFMFLTLLHLIWTYFPYNDDGNSFKCIKNEHNIEGIFDSTLHRSLTAHEFQEQYDYPNMNDKVLDDVDNNNQEYGIHYVSPYEQLSKRESNHMGVLQRNSKNRFGKKRGLAKLDHYFEKELFYKFDNIYEILNKMKNDKKNYKKKLLRKHGYKLISFGLLPLLGLIYYILCGDQNLGDGGRIIKYCSHTVHSTTVNNNCTKYMIKENMWKLEYMDYIFSAYFCIIIITVLVLIIYIFIKIITYERIKAIKGKMSLKEYCNFCKEVIRKT
ncbi:hypothetical protein PVIIG_00833 [Plasmodium vivax India VII]|uniref:Variable surface protein n=2 Tax=Plasmodium vivax TaxID=5855 RepID=A0A0J9S9V4_PLAVI|nr:hypothetical protein PVIIG_00833 [Plasmodium vivax India VII]